MQDKNNSYSDIRVRDFFLSGRGIQSDVYRVSGVSPHNEEN